MMRPVSGRRKGQHPLPSPRCSPQRTAELATRARARMSRFVLAAPPLAEDDGQQQEVEGDFRPATARSALRDLHGYISPRKPLLPAATARLSREKRLQMLVGEVEAKFSVLDEQLEVERFKYAKAHKLVERIQHEIIGSIPKVERYARAWRDPKVASKSAYATSLRIMALAERLRLEAAPRMEINRKLQRQEVFPARLKPKRAFEPPQDIAAQQSAEERTVNTLLQELDEEEATLQPRPPSPSNQDRHFR